MASKERFLPLCSAPVPGNLWSVTRILQRATCSPGRAAGPHHRLGRQPGYRALRRPCGRWRGAATGCRCSVRPLTPLRPCRARITLPYPLRAPLAAASLPSFAPALASRELGFGSPTAALTLLRSAPPQSPGRCAWAWARMLSQPLRIFSSAGGPGFPDWTPGYCRAVRSHFLEV